MVIEKDGQMLAVSKGRRIAFQKCMLIGREWCFPFADDGDKMIFQKSEGCTLKDWVREMPTVSEIEGIYRSLTRIHEDLDRYFLEEERLLFDPEWITVDRETGKLCLVYLPYYFEEGTCSPAASFFQQIPDFLWNELAKQEETATEVITKIFTMKKAFAHDDFTFGQEEEEENRMLPVPVLAEEERDKKTGRRSLSCLRGLFSFHRSIG